MDTAIHIGNTEGSAKVKADMIMEVVKGSAGDKVKIAAIRALSEILKVENVSISGLSVDASTNHNYPKQDLTDNLNDQVEDQDQPEVKE